MAAPWFRDPIVWLLTSIGVLACGLVVFGGRYLPYADWAGHVGLSAVLAYGDVSGADAYLTRSLVPTPYYLFYVCTAALGFVVPIEVAAKLNLLIATAVATLGAARLAEATGRSPRLCGIAALMQFGVSLGLGFASFVTGLPWLLHALADTERLYGARENRALAAGALAVMLTLCFLGHGLVFGFALLLIGLRTLVHLVRQPRLRGAVLYAAGSAVPAFALAVPSVARRLEQRYVSPEFMTPGGPALAGWVPFAKHLETLSGDLLDRGGHGHHHTMLLVVGWMLIVFVTYFVRDRHCRPARPQDGLPLYAATMTAMFLLGPVWIGWPVTFWVVYQRAGTLAAVLVSLLVPARLSGWPGAAVALLAGVPVIHNAVVNRDVVAEYSAWAAPYDRVRARIPPGQRVLPLNAGVTVRPGDTLYFYHLVDGAAYVPVGNIPEEVPVHRRNVAGTPYNPSVQGFDPRIHGRMYDYLVVHGSGPRRRVESSTTTHERLATEGPWTIYRTKKALPPSQVNW